VNPAGEYISQQMTATNVAQLNFASTNRLRGIFEPGLNFANYIDSKYLPGKKWDKTWDPEGMLSTLPAIASCLLGVFAGLFLKSSRTDEGKGRLADDSRRCGCHCWLRLSAQFPVVKRSGPRPSCWSAAKRHPARHLLLGDRCSLQSWASRLSDWNEPHHALSDGEHRGLSPGGFEILGGDVKASSRAITPGFGDLMLSLGEIGLAILLAWWLYRRKIFLRL
jgi:hypothetical protein